MYGYDTDFLDHPTEFRDYFIGLWIADGYQCLRNRRLRITSIDKCLIDQLIRAINFTNKVVVQTHENEKTKYHLDFSGRPYQRIVELGYDFGAKTGKEFLPSDIHNFGAFLRGLFDGDGTFGVKKDKYLNCSLISASSYFLKDLLQAIRHKHIVEGGSIRQQKERNAFILTFGHTDSIKLASYMYKDSTIKLDRKYQIYLEGRKHVLKCVPQKGKRCSVKDCRDECYAKDMCILHYSRRNARAYYHKNKEQVKKNVRTWQVKNKEFRTDYMKQYRDINREELNAKAVERNKRNPEIKRQINKRYREKLKQRKEK